MTASSREDARNLTGAMNPLKTSRRTIIKIGSSLLVDRKTGRLNRAWLTSLGDDVARLKSRGQDVVIVSSGVIALGRKELGLQQGTLRLEESQAAAAAGQIRLAHAYEDVLKPKGIVIAQILLTLTDTEERRRYLNARSTFETLLRVGAVPIVNENDTVATSEIRYGDNDRLAARVAQMISADCLILLSDIDGLYARDPPQFDDAVPVPVVHEVNDSIKAMASPVSPRDAVRLGSGGMETKLAAAEICLNAGCTMVIGNGHALRPVEAIENGARCTWFLPKANPLTARKQWISGSLKPKGTLTVDAGAVVAISQGKSLLPAGVRELEGRFERGDAVRIVDAVGKEIARGISAYSSADAKKIMGHNSGQIEELLGYRGRAAMVHADDLALNRRGPVRGDGEDT